MKKILTTLSLDELYAHIKEAEDQGWLLEELVLTGQAVYNKRKIWLKHRFVFELTQEYFRVLFEGRAIYAKPDQDCTWTITFFKENND